MRWFGVHKGEIWVLQCGWELITKIKVKGTLAAAGALLGRGGLATWFTRLLGLSDMSWEICWAACRQTIIMIAGSFWTSPPAHTNKMLLSLSHSVFCSPWERQRSSRQKGVVVKETQFVSWEKCSWD
jgi:hypothetical protein